MGNFEDIHTIAPLHLSWVALNSEHILTSPSSDTGSDDMEFPLDADIDNNLKRKVDISIFCSLFRDNHRVGLYISVRFEPFILFPFAPFHFSQSCKLLLLSHTKFDYIVNQFVRFPPEASLTLTVLLPKQGQDGSGTYPFCLIVIVPLLFWPVNIPSQDHKLFNCKLCVGGSVWGLTAKEIE